MGLVRQSIKATVERLVEVNWLIADRSRLNYETYYCTEGQRVPSTAVLKHVRMQLNIRNINVTLSNDRGFTIDEIGVERTTGEMYPMYSDTATFNAFQGVTLDFKTTDDTIPFIGNYVIEDGVTAAGKAFAAEAWRTLVSEYGADPNVSGAGVANFYVYADKRGVAWDVGETVSFVFNLTFEFIYEYDDGVVTDIVDSILDEDLTTHNVDNSTAFYLKQSALNIYAMGEYVCDQDGWWDTLGVRHDWGDELEGYVRHGDGTRADDVLVTAMLVVGGTPDYGDIKAQTYTDVDGDWTFKLDAGTYIFTFYKDGAQFGEVERTITG